MTHPLLKQGALKRMRLRLVLTQEELAQLLGVAAGTICRWENGQMTPSCYYLRLLDTMDCASWADELAGERAKAYLPRYTPRALYIIISAAFGRREE